MMHCLDFENVSRYNGLLGFFHLLLVVPCDRTVIGELAEKNVLPVVSLECVTTMMVLQNILSLCRYFIVIVHTDISTMVTPRVN